MSTGMNKGFLKFNSLPPRLHLTGDSEHPDRHLIRHLEEEGFDVTYLPHGTGGKVYKDNLSRLSHDLELGESYAILAFGAAAADCLEANVKPTPHLAALIAYYPSRLDPKAKFPSQLNLLCHIAGSQGAVGTTAFSSYTYAGARPGFAEHGSDSYDTVAASLAWTRTLHVLRKAFKVEVAGNLEGTREQWIRLQYGAAEPDAARTLAHTVNDNVHVTNVPTMTGGVGQKELYIFYRDYFCSPPTLRMKLISRTIGTDRVVDEMVISFKHTEEVPWMLPGVPATDKVVQIPMVSVVSVRGGRICHEHLYWDQASVLAQLGLLDAKLVPDSMRSKGLKRLPVIGAEAAAKILDEDSHASNELIPGWRDRPRGDPGATPSRRKQPANGVRSGGEESSS